jgi:hypothetical protein
MIYFAGGEPLISDFHWNVLNYLIDTGRTDVRICYNTNLLKLEFKQKNALSYWEKFDSVYIGASIDCIGERAEYVRYGTNWNKIQENIAIINEHPIIKRGLNLNITTSILTIGGLRDTLEWTLKYDALTDPTHVLLQNLVYSPESLSIKILPDVLKDQLWKPLRPLIANYGAGVVDSFEAELYASIDNDKLNKLRKKFKAHISLADSRRKNSIKIACPELAEWYDNL